MVASWQQVNISPLSTDLTSLKQSEIRPKQTMSSMSASHSSGKSYNLIRKRSDKGWSVKASFGSANTKNPIREIIETMNLAENPAKKVIPLSIGDPTIFGNLKPCEEILESLDKANSSGKFYGYQTAAGMDAAREAVADYYFKCTGSKIQKQDVILASGCSHAIDLCICVLANSGQNILIPRPGFPLYKTLTSVYNVQYKQYNLLADDNWSIDLKHLESLIDENTAAIIINNPSNPCGSVFSRKHLLEILELAELYKVPIIADEIYDKFVFSPQSYMIPANGKSSIVRRTNNNNNNNSWDSEDEPIEIDDGENRSELALASLATNNQHEYMPFIPLSSLSKTVPILTCGGISKTCLIPGLRLGWIIINDRQSIFDASVRSGLNRLTQRLMGPNSLVQGALPDILTRIPETFYTETMDFIHKNAKLCYDRLKLVNGLRPYMPQGSMYFMVKFDALKFPQIKSDLDFTSKLMNEESVLVLPGECFDFPNFFRLCLTVPTNVMEEALDRMDEFCKRHFVATDNDDDVVVIEAKDLMTSEAIGNNIVNPGKQQQLRLSSLQTPLANNHHHFKQKQQELSSKQQSQKQQQETLQMR